MTMTVQEHKDSLQLLYTMLFLKHWEKIARSQYKNAGLGGLVGCASDW